MGNIDFSALGRDIVLSAFAYVKDLRRLSDIDALGRGTPIMRTINGALQEAREAHVKAGGEAAEVSASDIIRELSDGDTDGLPFSANAFVQPALLCRKNGVMPYYLAELIAYAIRHDRETDTGLRQAIADSIHKAVRKYCKFDREIQLITLIADQYACIIDDVHKDPEHVSLIKKAYASGFDYEQKYGGCAQCTIAACYDAIGKKMDDLFQTATVLSGGCAVRTDGSCGSYSGAAIMIGSYIGRSFDGMLDGSDGARYDMANRLGQRLHKKYVDTYGGVTCADVQKAVFGESFRLYDQEDLKAFKAAGAHEEKCPSVVAAASAWVMEILLDAGLLPF